MRQGVYDIFASAAAVVKVLAEDKLEQFADRVHTRILEGREEKGKPAEYVTKQQQKYCDFVQKNAQPFQKFLDKPGGPAQSLTLATCKVMLCVVLLCRVGCLLQFGMGC